MTRTWQRDLGALALGSALVVASNTLHYQAYTVPDYIDADNVVTHRNPWRDHAWLVVRSLVSFFGQNMLWIASWDLVIHQFAELDVKEILASELENGHNNTAQVLSQEVVSDLTKDGRLFQVLFAMACGVILLLASNAFVASSWIDTGDDDEEEEEQEEEQEEAEKAEHRHQGEAPVLALETGKCAEPLPEDTVSRPAYELSSSELDGQAFVVLETAQPAARSSLLASLRQWDWSVVLVAWLRSIVASAGFQLNTNGAWALFDEFLWPDATNVGRNVTFILVGLALIAMTGIPTLLNNVGVVPLEYYADAQDDEPHGPVMPASLCAPPVDAVAIITIPGSESDA